jgi:hypothetical protein
MCFSDCKIQKMSYLFSWLAFHITDNMLCLSDNLIHNLFRLGPRLLHRLDVGTGRLLWCGSRLFGRSGFLGGGRGSSCLGLGNASRSYFAGTGLRRVGLGGRASFCGRDCVFNFLDETGLGVALV